MQDKTDYYAFGVELKGRNWKKTTDAKVTIIESIGTSGGSDPRIGE